MLRGLIAAELAINDAVSRLGGVPVAVGQGLVLLPGPVVDGEEPVGHVKPLWWGLVERVATEARAASAHEPVAYVEAEFFGGVGEQAAVVWHGGNPVLGPLVQRFPAAAAVTPESPINAALRRSGPGQATVGTSSTP